MLLDLGLIFGGLVVLILAGDFLVRGAVNLALRLGIPPLMVGMTVVAFGTSAPELLVSVQAAINDAGGLALGNVVGSNIANVLLVLGVPALIAAVAIGRDVTRDFVMMLGASVLFIAVAMTGEIGTWQALVLLGAFALFMADSIRRARASRAEVDDLEGADPSITGLRIAIYTVLGIVGLPLGAHLLVTGAVSVATELGVSDVLIGLTIVAVGTSLPELATTVMAAIRREGGVALGNVVGSNLFNLLFILGVAGLFGRMEVPDQMLRVDLWVMLGASLVLVPFIWREAPVTRLWGAAFLGAYGVYVWSLVATGV
jgi:cation:H+ antiporter